VVEKRLRTGSNRHKKHVCIFRRKICWTWKKPQESSIQSNLRSQKSVLSVWKLSYLLCGAALTAIMQSFFAIFLSDFAEKHSGEERLRRLSGHSIETGPRWVRFESILHFCFDPSDRQSYLQASRSPLGAEKTTPKMHKSYDKRRDKAENANRSTTRCLSFLQDIFREKR